MSYVTPEQITQAKRLDLLAYFQLYDPDELVQVARGTYCTKEHDSLKISNGKWHWFSKGIGGRTALDYLIKVQGYAFTEAVEMLSGRAAVVPSVSRSPPERRGLVLPERYRNNDTVRRYLVGRGIAENLIDFFVEKDLLYESANRHNAVFVGYDLDGTARHAALRGTAGSFKGEAVGSDKRYAFSILKRTSRELHVFESAIDLLSDMTLMGQAGQQQSGSLLSLGGVGQSRDGKLPPALGRFLEEQPHIEVVFLHLDNDFAGRSAAHAIEAAVTGRTVINAPPKHGKDVNEMLQIHLGMRNGQERGR